MRIWSTKSRWSGIRAVGAVWGVAALVGVLAGCHHNEEIKKDNTGTTSAIVPGDGTFTDMAEKVGLKDGGWSTSAAWVDYDKDGHLDLIVCHYVEWSPATDIKDIKFGHPTYSTPQKYKGEPVSLYHNDGKGRFTN